MSYIISDNPIRFSRFKPQINRRDAAQSYAFETNPAGVEDPGDKAEHCYNRGQFPIFTSKGTPAMATLVCIGANDAAMASRKLILTRAGHDVRQARDRREVKAEREATSFSVVVIGHPLNPNEKMQCDL